jgi:hypothetical protein
VSEQNCCVISGVLWFLFLWLCRVSRCPKLKADYEMSGTSYCCTDVSIKMSVISFHLHDTLAFIKISQFTS